MVVGDSFPKSVHLLPTHTCEKHMTPAITYGMAAYHGKGWKTIQAAWVKAILELREKG